MSTTTPQITCDGCGGDLTETGNSINWRLALVNEKIPCGPGYVTDMMIHKRLEENQHFCGMGCLEKWISARMSDRRDRARREADDLEMLLEGRTYEDEWLTFDQSVYNSNYKGRTCARVSAWRATLTHLRATQERYL